MIHLETTSKCNARCPQCGRIDYNTNKINPLVTDRNGKSGALDEISLSDFVKWFPPKFVSQLTHLYMCGTLGDPIFAKDCLKILYYLRVYNKNIDLGVHTNGSFRPKEWWEKLAKLNVRVVFGIDGLEDTHSLYRVNTNWNTVIENATTFIKAGGRAEWQMLVFKHNEHQIKECSRLAKYMGFESFHFINTNRFIDTDSHNLYPKLAVKNPKGEITHYLEPSQISLKLFHTYDSTECLDKPLEETSEKVENKIIDKVLINKSTIQCSAKRNREIYVAANGDLKPCCWMESTTLYNFNDMIDFKQKVNLYPNLHKQSLKEIFDSLYFESIKNTWNDDPLLICSKTCSKTTGLPMRQDRIIMKL